MLYKTLQERGCNNKEKKTNPHHKQQEGTVSKTQTKITEHVRIVVR